MNTIIAFVKRLRLARILVIFLAGFVLLVSTACTSPLIAKTSNPIDENTQSSSIHDLNENVDKLIKESYKTEPPQGGMNNHQDVDPRQNTSESQAKAKELIKQAQKNVQQGTRNSNDKVQNALGDLKDGIGQSAQQIKEGTQKGFKNLKNNLDSTVDQVSEIKEGTQKGFKNLKNNLDSTVDQVSDNIQQAVSNN